MELIKRECVDCNSEFEISVEAQEFFKSKNFDLPKRCKSCRIRRKQQREEEALQNTV